VRFSEHATFRMAERGIRPDWVERTLERPEFVRARRRAQRENLRFVALKS